MEVFLLEVGLSLLLVPPDVDLLVLLYMSLDVLLLLEVVAFGRAALVLLPVLPVSLLVVVEICLKVFWKVEVCLVSLLALLHLSSHPLTLQCLVMAEEFLLELMVLAVFLAFHSLVI